MNVFVFDIDDTLYDQIEPFRLAIDETFPIQVKEKNISMDALFHRFRFFSDLMFNQVESGDVTLADMRSLRIVEALNDFEVAITTAESLAFQKSYEANQAKIVMRDDMKEVLQLLVDRGDVLAILTNGPKEHQLKKIKQLGVSQFIPRDKQFISGEVGIAKPNVEVFQHIEASLSLEKPTFYYIGDSFENDIVGASTAGWKSIWLNKRDKPIPHGTIRPDIEVTTENINDVIRGILNKHTD